MELSVEELAKMVEEKRKQSPRTNPDEVLDEVLEKSGLRFPDFFRVRCQVSEVLFDRKYKRQIKEVVETPLQLRPLFESDSKKGGMLDAHALEHVEEEHLADRL